MWWMGETGCEGQCRGQTSSALPCPVDLCTAPSCRYVDYQSRAAEVEKSLGQEAVSSDLVVLQYMCLLGFSLSLYVCVCADLVVARILQKDEDSTALCRASSVRMA